MSKLNKSHKGLNNCKVFKLILFENSFNILFALFVFKSIIYTKDTFISSLEYFFIFMIPVDKKS